MNADVLIIGAGTAGATAAWKCAEEGAKTVLVDARPAGKAGATWVNGVEERLFSDIGLWPVPEQAIFHESSVYHLQSPAGSRSTCYGTPTLEIDMAGLNRALLEKAEEAGVEIIYSCSLDQPLIEGNAVVGAHFIKDGERLNINAPLTIDASGMHSVFREALPDSLWIREEVEAKDTCVAAQYVFELTDKDAAKRFLAANNVKDGEIFVKAGIRGGYSILNTSIDMEHGHVAFLAGAMLSQGNRAAQDLIEEGKKLTGCAGKKKFGGAGLIPVRRAMDQLVGNGFALVGNSASQVFPTHGSGVAAGMRAAAILAAVAGELVRAEEPMTIENLWPYATAYQRGRGAICASQQVVREMTESLHPGQTDQMFRLGLINEQVTIQSMDCQPLSLGAGHVMKGLKAARVAPTLIGRVAATGVKAAAVSALYHRYPEKYSARSFQRWRGTRKRLLN
ncbi:MAG: FAD-dependent oxidoreductase [Myxococcales bacterium]|nr:FAD-dependent oxidoreductase [Myxococcales bacterium]